MKHSIQIAGAALVLTMCLAAQAEEFLFLKAKVELVVEDAQKSYASAPDPACKYYYGLIYGTGTNLLARADSSVTTQKMRKYLDLAEKDYAAYTKVSAATDKAAATGSDTVTLGRWRVKNGERKRASRLISADKLRDRELESAVKRWESFATQLVKEKK